MANKPNEFSGVSDDAFAVVARELATGGTDEALWTKAFALQNGNEAATKAHYIRLRVEQITRNSTREISACSTPSADDTPLSAGPWARFFARNLDLTLEGALALFLVRLLAEWVSSGASPWLAIVLLMLALLLLPWFFDALVVTMFGNSLGKAIWGISVRHKDGRPLNFKEVLSRNLLVCLHGLWLGLTPLTFLALIFSYNRLKKDGVTKWDANKYDVSCSNPSSLRKIVGVVLYVTNRALLGPPNRGLMEPAKG